MRYLPINIDTRDKSILIIGGGNVAYRRCKKLLDTEFKIFIVAMEFNEKILELFENNKDRLFLKKEKVDENFKLSNYDYIIIATNDSTLNSSLERKIKDLKIPYVRSDKSSDSTFIMSKVINSGEITVSVSTGGKNPTITKIIGEEILDLLKKYKPEKIQILNYIREELVK